MNDIMLIPIRSKNTNLFFAFFTISSIIEQDTRKKIQDTRHKVQN